MIDKEKRGQNNGKSPPVPYFEIEARGGILGASFLISGCIKITEFSEKLIHLKLKGGSLKIEGEELKITVFENKNLQIRGKIENLAIEYKKCGRQKYEGI